MTDAPLLLARSGPVAELVLNRPAALNALNAALIDDLTRTIRDLSADDSLRAIILSGAGRAFCAGVDLKELSGARDVAGSLTWSGADSLLTVMRDCPHPVICAVQGYAVTGGLELALMGDFILAAETAKFADTHARVGITPSWGMTQVLPRLIGLNRARQMSLTGDFVDAATARDWGLVTEVLPEADLMPRARALALRISETDAPTLRRIRDLIGLSADLPLSEGLEREAAGFGAHIQGVTADAVADARARVTTRGRALNSPDQET